MDLYIQMGYGMQKICMELSEYWNGATVILSPLNISPDKIAPFSKSFIKANGKVLLDPQMYSPSKYHKNLQKYDYFPKTGIVDMKPGDYCNALSALARINDEIGSEAFILPSQTILNYDEHWHKNQYMIAKQGRELANGRKVFHTISLSSDVVIDDTQIENIIQSSSQWNVDGVYIVCEHPLHYYLVDMPIWIANLLSMVAGIKRTGKKVIIGYANHQLLCLALAKCDAIASGSFLNLRRFLPERFESMDYDEPSRRAIWYYCPQVLSEFKVTYLDVAMKINQDAAIQTNLLSRMLPPTNMQNPYSKILFQGALPSSTLYKESDSFKHYLHCLMVQTRNSVKPSYKETLNSLTLSYKTASSLFKGLHDAKIKGQDRDFFEIIDANEAAISVFDSEFGFAMKHEWDEL